MFWSGSPPPGLHPQRFGFSALLLGFLQNMVLRTLHIQSYNPKEVQEPLCGTLHHTRLLNL
jgi:hypothetical protein